MNRLQAILAAGTLTAVVLAAVLVFGGFDFARAFAGDSTPPAPTPDAEQLQAEQQQLQATLTLMRQREAEYQAQIEAANQTISRLEADLTEGAPAPTDAQLREAYQTIEQLQATVGTMQQRETQYASQIEAANQTILQLQDYINQSQASGQPAAVQQARPAANALSSGYVGEYEHEDEDDDWREDEGEHHEEEHEYEEHDDD